MYVVIEGIDGSGKSTQVSLVRDHLKKVYGRNVVVISEPDRKIFEAIDTQDQKAIATASYIQRIKEKEMIERLSNRTIVLSDRSFVSTFAYQGITEWRFVSQLHNFMRDFIAIPDLAIILVGDVDLAVERIISRGDETVDEKTFSRLESSDIIYKKYDCSPGVYTHYVCADSDQGTITLDIVNAILDREKELNQLR